MGRRWLSLNDLADYMGVSVKTLRNWKTTDPGKLPPHVDVNFGGKYAKLRFDSEAVDAWLLSMNGNDKGVAL